MVRTLGWTAPLLRAANHPGFSNKPCDWLPEAGLCLVGAPPSCFSTSPALSPTVPLPSLEEEINKKHSFLMLHFTLFSLCNVYSPLSNRVRTELFLYLSQTRHASPRRTCLWCEGHSHCSPVLNQGWVSGSCLCPRGGGNGGTGDGFTPLKAERNCLWPASRPAAPGGETPLLSMEPRGQISFPALTSQTINLALLNGAVGGDGNML